MSRLSIIPGANDRGGIMPFWRGVLGYDPRSDSSNQYLVDPHGRLALFWFEEMGELRADGARSTPSRRVGAAAIRPSPGWRRVSPRAGGVVRQSGEEELAWLWSTGWATRWISLSTSAQPWPKKNRAPTTRPVQVSAGKKAKVCLPAARSPLAARSAYGGRSSCAAGCRVPEPRTLRSRDFRSGSSRPLGWAGWRARFD